MNCSSPSAVCSIVPLDNVVPASSITQYTCSRSAQSIPTNTTDFHLLLPMCGYHARRYQQPCMGPAFETHLPIGGHPPRHPRGEIVSVWRSSREEELIFSPGGNLGVFLFDTMTIWTPDYLDFPAVVCALIESIYLHKLPTMIYHEVTV